MNKLDMTKMGATRVPRGGLPAPLSARATPPPKLGRLLAEVCALAVRGDRCLICGGASWVGPHDLDCPVEKAMAATAKEYWLRPDGLHINTPDYVTRGPGGKGILIRTIPYEAWIRLDLDQRDDAARRQAKGKTFKAVEIKCRWCENQRHILRPLLKEQAPDECHPCFKLRLLGADGLRLLIKQQSAEAKLHASHRHMYSARAAADKAKLALKILKGA